MDNSFSEHGPDTQSVHCACETISAQANHCQGWYIYSHLQTFHVEFIILYELKICISIHDSLHFRFRSIIFAQFRFHNNGYNDLHDLLGKECLPDEYGGTNGPIDYEKSLKFVLAREKMLELNRSYGVKSPETP